MTTEKAETGYTSYGPTSHEDDPYNTSKGEMKCRSIESGQPATRHDLFKTEERRNDYNTFTMRSE